MALVLAPWAPWWLPCLVAWLTLPARVLGDIHVGAAINIFNSFGDLGALVKVKGAGPWFPQYLSADVFERVLEIRSPLASVNDDEFNGDFILQLCDNVSQLKAALFQGHILEGVEKPWRAYTGSWSKNVAAAHLGVNSSYLTNSHGYALVRLTRQRQQVSLSPDYELHFNQWTAEGASRVVPEQPETVFEFFATFGSHYINSYVSGDSLFQVFVFSPSEYEGLHRSMKEYEVTGQGLKQVFEYLTPWRTEHIGRMVSLSGNVTVELWAEQKLRSLLNLRSNPELLQVLNFLLGNEALLQLDLRSLAPYFPEEKQPWFREILDNHMELWEISV